MKKETVILVFGDSITYGAVDKNGGWVQYLRKLLNDKDDYSVYNLGVSGNTTQDLVQRFESEAKHRIDDDDDAIIIFAIGINDSYISSRKNNVSLRAFENNIKKLAASALNFSNKVVFVGLTPVDNRKTNPVFWDKHISHKNEDVRTYNDMLRNICKYNEILFIDIYDKFMKANYRKLLDDGLHPNTKGHAKIFKIVREFLIAKKMI